MQESSLLAFLDKVKLFQNRKWIPRLEKLWTSNHMKKVNWLQKMVHLWIMGMILKLNLVNLLTTMLIQMIQIMIEVQVLEEVLPGVLGSQIEDVLCWLVLAKKHLNLLPPNRVRAFQKALHQMACLSVLKKDVALLSAMPLHADIVLHLQSSLLVLIVMVIEISEGTLIETQTTEVILSALRHDVFEVHEGAGVVQDTKAEEVGVEASPAVQCAGVSETVNVAGVQGAVLVQKTGGLP